MEPDTVCIQVLEPFEAGILLGSYASGSYSVFVNGEGYRSTRRYPNLSWWLPLIQTSASSICRTRYVRALGTQRQVPPVTRPAIR